MGEIDPKATDPIMDIEWTVDTEVHLLSSMVGHKPVGVNKHFQMACIWNKFTSSINKNVTSDAIWKRLETMYDLATLDDAEVIPFPNNDQDFALPEEEFSSLITEKLKKITKIKHIDKNKLADDEKDYSEEQVKLTINERENKKERKLSVPSKKDDIKLDSLNKKGDKDSNKKEEKRKCEEKNEILEQKEQPKKTTEKCSKKSIDKEPSDKEATSKKDTVKKTEKDDKKEIKTTKEEDKKITSSTKKDKKDDKKELKTPEKKEFRNKDDKKRDSEKKIPLDGNKKELNSVEKKSESRKDNSNKKSDLKPDKKSESKKRDNDPDNKPDKVIDRLKRISRERSDSETSVSSKKEKTLRDSISKADSLDDTNLAKRVSLGKRSSRNLTETSTPLPLRRRRKI